jgi:3-dehydroquinate dehydratase / shikimate dehydrogenase
MKCFVITEKTISGCEQVFEEYKDLIDMVEIRADFLDTGEAKRCAELSLHIKETADIPLVLTLRLPEDGGHFKGSAEQRIALYKNAVINGNYDYIDLEENLQAAELEQAARDNNTTIVRSFHDFKKVPENLSERIRNLPRSADEIAKAAVYPNSTEDFFRICEAALDCNGIKKVILGMGEFGFPSRLLDKKLGSMWTYCAKDGAEPAPGHISPRQMEEVYNYSAINMETSLFGIIGNPVMHTKSPLIHNNGFRKQGINALYLPFPTDNPYYFFQKAGMLGLKGLSVTVPHKKAILDIASEISPEAKAIGSANTMIAEKASAENIHWKASNTDAPGFMHPLKGKLTRGMSALVAGAGGTSRTILYSLKKAGCAITLANRTRSKAEALAEEFGTRVCGLDELGDKSFELIVQTGTAGMTPQDTIDPLSSYLFKGHELVYDVVYAPPKTVMLKRAEQAGCDIINGWPMLIGQAAEQFRLFCGKELPEIEV